MTTIHTSAAAHSSHIPHSAGVPSAARISETNGSSTLAAIESRYPNLDADLAKAREDLADVQGSDSWGGLKWFEKALFFIPPFGPLIGVAMLGANKDMIQNAEKKVDELERVANLRQELLAATRLDSFERISA